MHESTRRRLCRAAFWLVCVAPTALVLGWCHWQQQPARVAEAEAQLSALTGLSAQVASVSRPRPGVLRLGDVQLREPEGGALVARCERLELRSFRKLLKVSAVGVRLEADRLAALWPAIDRRMQHWQADWPAVAVHCPLVVVASKHGQMELQTGDCDLAGLRFEPKEEEVQGWLAFCVAEMGNAGKVTLWARRTKQASTPTTRFELASAEARLPAWLLADGCPPLGQIDPQARLRGKLAATYTPAGWDADLANVELNGKDLHRALSAKLPSFGPLPLRMHVKTAALREGRIERAEGLLTSEGSGTTTKATVLRVAAALGLGAPNDQKLPAGEIEFVELKARFHLDHEGLRLAGHCGKTNSGVVLRATRGALLTAPRQPPRDATDLVACFATETTGTVPSSTAAVGLLPLLRSPLFTVSERLLEQEDTSLR